MTAQKPQTASKVNASIFLDSSMPNMARIFDYLAGGAANFEVDRQAAAQMLKAIPSLRKWVRLRRAFIQEAVLRLYQEGFTQFLDLGSGMPSEEHVHAFVPEEVRIVYSDINPVAVSYGSGLFSDLVNVAYIQGNARQAEEILGNPAVQTLITTGQKVAIGLNALMLFLTTEENQALARVLFDWAPVGSKLFLVLQTKSVEQTPTSYQQFQSLTQAAGLRVHLYSLEEAIEMLNPWQPEYVEPITTFLGLPADFIKEADREGIGMSFYAAFFTRHKKI